MELSGIDVATFVGFIAVVVAVSLYASRKEDTSESYFLAGLGLTWWLVGVSLVASNVSNGALRRHAGQGLRARPRHRQLRADRGDSPWCSWRSSCSRAS